MRGGIGVLVAVMLLTASLAVRAHPAAALGAANVQAAAATAAPPPPVFTRMCGGRCHGVDRIVGGRRSRAQWDEVLEKMAVEGAEGSDEDFLAVTEYLVSEYGRVNINTDPAADLAKVLHLEAKDAEAIVGYRKEHGKFEDFAALSAVPGVAVAALQQRREAIVF